MPPPVTGEDGVASLAVAIECLNGRPDGAAKSAPYIKAVPGQRRARAAFAEP
jgi:hypothetical protein